MKTLLVLVLLLTGCAPRPRGQALPLRTPSLVLLLSHALNLTAAQASAQLQQEFQRPFPVLPAAHPGPDPPDFIAPEQLHLQIAVQRDVFRLTQLNRPYVEDIYRWPFIKNHQAWLAIDSVAPHPTPQTERALARLLAALAPPGVVAVYLPAHDRMVPAPPSLPAILRSADPIGQFSQRTIK